MDCTWEPQISSDKGVTCTTTGLWHQDMTRVRCVPDLTETKGEQWSADRRIQASVTLVVSGLLSILANLC